MPDAGNPISRPLRRSRARSHERGPPPGVAQHTEPARLPISEEVMLTHTKRLSVGLALVLASSFALTACSMGASTSTQESDEPMTESSAPATEESMDPAANLAGAGCAASAEMVPAGAGSVAGLGQGPVAVAASSAASCVGKASVRTCD